MTINDILSDVMQRPTPPVESTTMLSDIAGWDSVMMVRLMLKLEEIAGRELSDGELEALVSVGDVERIARTG